MPTDSGKSGTKEREYLYRMIVSQLYYDGYQQIASSLANSINSHPACPPSDKLNNIVALGLQVDKDTKSSEVHGLGNMVAPGTGIDLEFENDVQSLSPDAAQYETCYVTAHKGPCRTAAFHQNGTLIATGSEDASIKILDVDRMLSKSATPAEIIAQETPQQLMENHPVIRTLYDHTDEVTCLDFHPKEQILISGSKDHTVKLYDFSKPSVKKAYKSIVETENIRSVNFHPSGDFALVGTEHPTLRLYDVETLQCFVCSYKNDQHTGTINMANYSPNANMYVSCSDDGDIKIWDGVSNRCINTFSKAHGEKPVSSVMFSKNSKYVLSAGKDALVKLWELSMSRCLIAYTGAGSTELNDNRIPAVFNHTEDYVIYPDEGSVSLCCWDSRNAERQKLLALGHSSLVRTLVHSPTGPSFVSCSDDHRARFWYRRAETD